MKCKKCGNRFFKSTIEGTSFFFKRLIVKSDTTVTVVCNQCGEGSEPNTEMMTALRKAVLVRVN